MARIVQPLRRMGAEVMGRGGDSLAPLTIRGGELRGIEYDMPVASAQVKSSLIIASLFAGGQTMLHQPALSRDHTERMLGAMGASVIEDGLTLVVKPGPELKPLDVKVSGDISSAAFWLVAAAAHPNAKVRLTNVGVNPSRAEVIEILKAMGAQITLENHRIEGGEPVADIYVESSELRGVEIAGDQIPIAQDEIPVLALAACFAQGTTVIRDAQELRVKESDRNKRHREGAVQAGRKNHGATGRYDNRGHGFSERRGLSESRRPSPGDDPGHSRTALPGRRGHKRGGGGGRVLPRFLAGPGISGERIRKEKLETHGRATV